MLYRRRTLATQSKYIEMNAEMIFLIIDHVTSNQEALKVALKKMGYRNFVTKTSGLDALNFIKKEETSFILSRLELPDMSGTEILEEIKNDLSIQRVPFMMFSEEMDSEDIAFMLETGVDAHLTIPFYAKDLASKVSATWSRYIDPDNIEFQFEIGRKHFMKEEYQEAIDVFSKIAAKGKLLARCGVATARVMFQTGEVDRALEKCQKICEDELSKSVHSFQLLGELLLEKQDPVGAVQSFMKALEISPKNPYRYQIISEICNALERYVEAEGILRQAESRKMKYTFVFDGLATALIHQNKPKEAMEYYNEVVKKDGSARSYNNLAICAKKIRDFNRAIDCFNRALDLDPKDTRIRFNLALVYLDRGKVDLARQQLAKIIAIDPAHEKARLKLLFINDPEAYKKKSAETIKSSHGVADHSSSDGEESQVIAIRSAITEKVRISPAEQKKIIDLISSLRLESIKKDTEKKIELPEEVKAKLTKLGPTGSSYYYLMGLKNVRHQQFKLMQAWFKSIIDISEELVADILNISSTLTKNCDLNTYEVMKMITSESPKEHPLYSTVKQAFVENAKFKEEIAPIIIELQFQDYIRQALKCMEVGYKLVYQDGDKADIWDKVQKSLISEPDRVLFRKVVLGQDVSEDQTAEVQDVLFF